MFGQDGQRRRPDTAAIRVIAGAALLSLCNVHQPPLYAAQKPRARLPRPHWWRPVDGKYHNSVEWSLLDWLCLSMPRSMNEARVYSITGHKAVASLLREHGAANYSAEGWFMMEEVLVHRTPFNCWANDGYDPHDGSNDGYDTRMSTEEAFEDDEYDSDREARYGDDDGEGGVAG